MMKNQSLSQILSVVVLGASRGIGSACARALAAQGAQEIHLVARSLAKLEGLAADLHREFPALRVRCHGVDLMDPAQLEAWLGRMEDAGEFPRHWIFNVGGRTGGSFTGGPYESFPWSEIESQIRFNLELPLRITHAILPELLRPMPGAVAESHQGSLIYLSSQAGYFARPGFATYAAAKSGLSLFAQSLFEEVREHGLRVSVVAPGMVDTPLLPDNPKQNRAKFIRPESIADAVCWALAADARMCPVEIHIRPQFDPVKK
ncbi:MAG: SDR family oxidoreductase [Bdellovibrionales bacterium]|nr:SDR family oxidoreductase [Bdellovibrionales bacterium]